jgi:UDP-hydrolysing UDP-N-acetyl-D-glucosamine 2-epimerase
MRTVAVVTGSRADFGIYRPILKTIETTPGIEYRLYVCGAHLSPDFGNTVDEIEGGGFGIARRINTYIGSNEPADIAASMAAVLTGFADAFSRDCPDIVLLLGDRYEMFAAAAAAQPFVIPLAHIHGGESSEGAFDEAFRHAITKMSHLHFASTETYARRIMQMGEDPERVFVTGAPALDNLANLSTGADTVLNERLKMSFDPAPLLVTFHPVTLEYQETESHVTELVTALEAVGLPVVFTYPNADTAGQVIVDAIHRYIARHPESRAVENLGTDAYFALMKKVAAMVGNSSSGIIEAASFCLPVVDIGNRQKGRVRGPNVLHASCSSTAIVSAINQSLAPDFRATLNDLPNIYGDGKASERIVDTLCSMSLGGQLVQKTFFDLNTGCNDG